MLGLVAQSCPILCNPMDCIAYQGPLLMGFSRKEYCSGLACPTPGDLPNPGIKPRSPALRVDSLLAEPPEKPKDTGVGSLSLLQGIFLTQEPNQGFLHCTWTLHQLNYQGSLSYISSVYMLIPNSQFISRLPFPFGNHKFAFE